jgi:heavy metal translocating P-type ATPase
MNNLNHDNRCDHCSELIINEYTDPELNDKRFCCNGCLSVYRILNHSGLQDYYSIKEQDHVNFKKPQVVNGKFNYLDSDEARADYISSSEHINTITFYLEGIHCLACLWLIEKLPEIHSNILESKLNFGNSIVTIKFHSSLPPSKIAELLNNLGYKPHPLSEENDFESLQKKENRKDLIKIGVAGFSTGNNMVYAIATYAGATGSDAELFLWWSFVVSLPTILYSASSFYRNAWSALKNQSISLDVPIVLAISVGTVSGVVGLLKQSDIVYFDTITTLIFLLLSARYILKRVQQQGLSSSNLHSFFSGVIARKIENGEEQDIHTKYLKKNDTVKVKASETIPSDGLIIKGSGLVNNSILTGESLPILKKEGESVFFGSILSSGELLIQVKENTQSSKLGKILKSLENGWEKKTKISRLSDTIAKYFVSTVILISLAVFFYFYQIDQPYEGFIRALSLIIITCPCALGLTTPLAFTLSLKELAKKGILVKREDIIERANLVDTIFLDKTGTLTTGNYKVQKNDLTTSQASLLYHLESRSYHPIAKTLCAYLVQNFKIDHSLTVEDYSETIGRGVSGSIAGKYYEVLGTSEDGVSKTITLLEDNTLLARLSLSDEIKPDTWELIKELKKDQITPVILSGDNQKIVNTVAQKIGVEEAHGDMLPEKKVEMIHRSPYSLMVGDGVNDATALSQSFVSIAVHQSVDVSLRVADVYLTQASLKNILVLLRASKKILRYIKGSLFFSILYNLLGTYLAITGYINPLMAAILMPISSITVLMITLSGAKSLRKIN